MWTFPIDCWDAAQIQGLTIVIDCWGCCFSWGIGSFTLGSEFLGNQNKK